jgi:autotransporter-associated beta strand protein
MRSARKNFTGTFSAISMAAAAALAAKSASAAVTITPYYGNDQSGTTPNAVIVATDSIGDNSTVEHLTQGIVNTINMPLGDYLFMAVDAVVTGDSNPDGGLRENAHGITTNTSGSVVQPQYLGLASVGVQVLSSDATASLLQPVATHVPIGTYHGITNYNSTASVNDTSGNGDNSGYTAGNNSGGSIAPDWAAVQSVGNVAPGVGSAGTSAQIGGGNLPSVSYTAFGVQKLQYFASSAASPSYADATEIFDSLAYGTVGSTPGVVTLWPQIYQAATGYWALSTPATTSSPSVYRLIVAQSSQISNLPPLVIDIGNPSSLTWNNAGATGPSDGVTWDINNNNNWNNGVNPTTYGDGAVVTFNDTNNGHYAVTLNSTVSPGSVTVNNSSGNYTISGTGSIAGNAWLNKYGTSTLTLSTTNTYSGGTTLNAGTFVVNNTTGSATGTGNVILNGGILASGTTGFISGDVLVGSGSNTIAPGGVGTVGSLTIGGLITTTSDPITLDFDLGTGTGIVTNGDLLILGADTISGYGMLILTFGGTALPGDDYRLIGGPSGTWLLDAKPPLLGYFTLPTAPAGESYALSISVDPGYLDLVVTSVPEPATASLLLIASAGMLVRRRRKGLA